MADPLKVGYRWLTEELRAILIVDAPEPLKVIKTERLPLDRVVVGFDIAVDGTGMATITVVTRAR
jgi:hypothetical protein